jgi:hypothetical protein
MKLLDPPAVANCNLVARSVTDMSFWMFTGTTCHSNAKDGYKCDTTVENTVAAPTNQLDCNWAPVGPLYSGHACHRAFYVQNDWFYVDSCSTSDWVKGAPGSFAGKLLTWGNAWVANCYYTSHSQVNKPTCGYTITWYQTQVRCY